MVIWALVAFDRKQNMSGERDLTLLLGSLDPVLADEVYTFATVPETEERELTRPLGVFREAEGVSVICTRTEARALGLKHEGAFRKITLSVHSSLGAVGLTARVATALAEHGIACNVVAAFHHDHLFVPAERAAKALKILSALQ